MHLAEVLVRTCGVEREGEGCACVGEITVECSVWLRCVTFTDARDRFARRRTGCDGVADTGVLVRPGDGLTLIYRERLGVVGDVDDRDPDIVRAAPGAVTAWRRGATAGPQQGYQRDSRSNLSRTHEQGFVLRDPLGWVIAWISRLGGRRASRANPSGMKTFPRAFLAACLVVTCSAPFAVGAVKQPSHSVAAALQVSEAGGLGRIELHGDLAAVLQRNEGIVSLIDISKPTAPKVLGRYDDGASQSLDGDLAFSSDGKWLFYARQTVQFSRDGVHVIDISDPSAPTLASYQPGGGTLRVGHYDDGTDEWVVTMDATSGMVVSRFEPTTGALVPVHVSALPALKVGGPASAGIVIQKDPILKKPLLYASTGETGVEVFDFSDPTSPVLLGSWAETGLAEIEVRVEGKKRLIYGAFEYWFEKTNKPYVVELDASDLEDIKQKRLLSVACKTDDSMRVQGMALAGRDLYVANSGAGLPIYFGDNFVRFVPVAVAKQNGSAGFPGASVYVFDVEVAGRYVYVTDGANGYLTVVERSMGRPWDYNKQELPWHTESHRKTMGC